MKITKKQLLISLISIAIVAVSLAVMLCDFFVPLNIWTHPILNFLFCLCVGFGIMTMALGISKKSPWYFFLSSVLLGCAIIYVLLQYIPWWIGVVCVGALLIIIAIVCFIFSNNQTESIALNKSSEYKNYQQRKTEKEEAEKSEIKEELPEIKSFK